MKHGVKADVEEARWYFVSSCCCLNVALTVERGIFNESKREGTRCQTKGSRASDLLFFHDKDVSRYLGGFVIENRFP